MTETVLRSATALLTLWASYGGIRSVGATTETIIGILSFLFWWSRQPISLPVPHRSGLTSGILQGRQQLQGSPLWRQGRCTLLASTSYAYPHTKNHTTTMALHHHTGPHFASTPRPPPRPAMPNHGVMWCVFCCAALWCAAVYCTVVWSCQHRRTQRPVAWERPW